MQITKTFNNMDADLFADQCTALLVALKAVGVQETNSLYNQVGDLLGRAEDGENTITGEAAAFEAVENVGMFLLMQATCGE